MTSRSTLITALMQVARYPEPAQQVELVETHAAWVLLAGDFAYKIKKPIRLPFLDYSTLERRRVCCEAELSLNRRFAADLYLGVVAITGSVDDPQIDGSGTVIEYAVKMRRFDEMARMDHVCRRGEVTSDDISQLVNAIIAFHRIAAVAPGGASFGTPSAALAQALENFDELRLLLPDPQHRSRLDALCQWTQAEFLRCEPAFAARRAEGYVRECHGDLHLGNLVRIAGRVTLFDCIEFNEDFRWIDVASEVAFTYVDLLDHGQPGLAGWLLTEWLSGSADFGAVAVMRFYAVYRAMVRAKVAAIRAGQSDADFSETGTYLALAHQMTTLPKPSLTITHGLAGCGKTTVAMQRLRADPAGATLRLRSDVERKRLFGLAENAISGSPIDGGIYGPEANALTYLRLHELARKLLDAGWSVIVDAAFLLRTERAMFRALATEIGCDFFVLAPQAAPDQLLARIATRLANGQDASEATPGVLQRQMEVIEALDSTERNCLLEV